MELDQEKLSLAIDFTKQCLLPEFDRDIGDQPLERDDFNVFVYGLNQNLRLLFDIVGKNEQHLFKPFEETELFRVNFILLLSEQSGYTDSPFQTDDLSLVKHLRTLVDKYYQNILKEKTIFEKCLDFYKQRLTGAKWKRNIGALYGYLRFCELNYVQLKKLLTSDESLFMLSVGMLLVEYFEMEYKHFGLKLFSSLMDCGTLTILSDLNIVEAIYNKLMDPLIVIIKDEAITVTLLECLYKCIENDTSWKQPSDWNKIDDILEEILKRIAFENDNRCISNLFLFVAKLTSLPIKDNDVLQKEIKFSVIDKTSEKNADAIVNNFDNLRDVCRIYDNLLIYRWIKKLFQLFGHQTFLGRTEDTRIQLHAVHVCYLICIYGIPVKLLNTKWIEFVEAFVPNLINLLKYNKMENVIKEDVHEFLKTISSQIDTNLENADDSFKPHLLNVNKSLNELRNAISS